MPLPSLLTPSGNPPRAVRSRGFSPACQGLAFKSDPFKRSQHPTTWTTTTEQFRKDFTPSERVAIGEAIEREFAQRHGGDRKSEDQGGKFSTLKTEPEGQTRDLVAKATGFGNGKTYAIPSETIAAWTIDKGWLSEVTHSGRPKKMILSCFAEFLEFNCVFSISGAINV